MPEMDSTQVRRRIAALLSIATLTWILYAISAQRHLFGDGSHFFLKLLEDRWFIYSDDVSRHHSHLLTQAPVVALLALFDVRSVEVLSWAFGLGLFLPFAIGLWTSWLAVRDVDARLMLFPVLCLYGASANQALMIVHESHVATSLFWPLLFYVTLRDRFDWVHGAIAVVLAVFFIRTYESVAVTGSVLVVLLAWRALSGWRGASPLTRAVWTALLVVLLAGVATAAWAVIHPRVPSNRSDFFASLSKVSLHWPLMASLAFMAVIGLLLTVDAAGRHRWPYAVAVVVLAACAVHFGLSPAGAPRLLRPAMHNAGRSVIVLLPALLALPAILVGRRFVVPSDATWARAWVLLLVLVAGQVSWQMLASAQWSGFRRIFREELAAHVGPTPIEATRLNTEQVGIQVVRRMTWGWAYPSLSVVWSRSPAVTTLILGSAADVAHYQPFDPLKADRLPKLERYGYSFEPYLAALATER
jgi:hypothetical protein